MWNYSDHIIHKWCEKCLSPWHPAAHTVNKFSSGFCFLWGPFHTCKALFPFSEQVSGDGQGWQESPVPTGLGWWWASSSSSSLNSSCAPDFLLHSVFKLFTLQQVLGSQWHLQFCRVPSHHTFISFDSLRWSVLGFSSSSDNQEPAGRNPPPAPLLIFWSSVRELTRGNVKACN